MPMTRLEMRRMAGLFSIWRPSGRLTTEGDAIGAQLTKTSTPMIQGLKGKKNGQYRQSL
jgi:hypothetical protein